jgi:hypothetical protein
MTMASDMTGYRRLGTSGLLVPMSVERHREVWLMSEWKLLDRAARLCEERGVRLTLACRVEGCRGLIQRVDDDASGPILRCDCSDRVFVRAL